MTIFVSFIYSIIEFFGILNLGKKYIVYRHFSVFIHMKHLNIFRRNMLLTELKEFKIRFVYGN